MSFSQDISFTFWGEGRPKVKPIQEVEPHFLIYIYIYIHTYKNKSNNNWIKVVVVVVFKKVTRL